MKFTLLSLFSHIRHREVKEHTQGFTASKWHSCYLNTVLMSDSRTSSVTTLLYCFSKGEKDRCVCFSSFLFNG